MILLADLQQHEYFYRQLRERSVEFDVHAEYKSNGTFVGASVQVSPGSLEKLSSAEGVLVSYAYYSKLKLRTSILYPRSICHLPKSSISLIVPSTPYLPIAPPTPRSSLDPSLPEPTPPTPSFL